MRWNENGSSDRSINPLLRFLDGPKGRTCLLCSRTCHFCRQLGHASPGVHFMPLWLMLIRVQFAVAPHAYDSIKQQKYIKPWGALSGEMMDYAIPETRRATMVRVASARATSSPLVSPTGQSCGGGCVDWWRGNEMVGRPCFRLTVGYDAWFLFYIFFNPRY